MKAFDALQMQADLKERLRNSPMWVQFADRMLSTMAAQQAAPDHVLDLTSDGATALADIFRSTGSGQRWVDEEIITLSRAETFIITQQMLPLVRMAAASFPDDVAFSPEMLPSPDGFLIFEVPWESQDVRSQRITIRAVSWSSGHNGRVHINEFTDLLNDPDDISARLKREDPAYFKLIVRGYGRLQLHHVYSLRYGQVLGSVGSNFADHLMRESAASGPSVMMTIWHLMGQTLTDVNRARIAPKYRDKLKRLRLPNLVSVITLRRRAMTAEAPSQIFDRTFRWPVRGHWHGYWCGAGEDRKLIKKYVHPYFKGPEGAPVRITKHVTRLAR